jgi:hypothetical protein
MGLTQSSDNFSYNPQKQIKTEQILSEIREKLNNKKYRTTERKTNSDYVKKLIYWDKDKEIKIYDYSEPSIVIFTKKEYGKTYNHIFKQNGGKFNFHFKTPEGDIAPGHTFSKVNSNVRNMILSLYNVDINKEVKLEQKEIKENELAG